MKAKHTPGPWTYRHLSIQDGGEEKKRFEIRATSDLSVKICDGKDWDEEDFANASLIAAAPELLEAVKDALLLADLQDLEGAAIDNYRRIIAKAEGK